MRWVSIALVALAFACGKARSEGTVEPSGTPSIAASSAHAPAATTPAITRPTAAWRGTYKSSAAVLYIPADWKDVHWRVKETSAGIGDGSITLQVDSSSGRVLGTLDGPLGPATIDGLSADGKLTASIARKDPSDGGFTGTLLASVAKDRVEGTIHASVADANAIRTAPFEMSPDPAIPAGP